MCMCIHDISFMLCTWVQNKWSSSSFPGIHYVLCYFVLVASLCLWVWGEYGSLLITDIWWLSTASAHKPTQPSVRENTLFHLGLFLPSFSLLPFIYTNCVNNTSTNEMPQLSNGCGFSQKHSSITFNAKLSHKNKPGPCQYMKLYSIPTVWRDTLSVNADSLFTIQCFFSSIRLCHCELHITEILQCCSTWHQKLIQFSNSHPGVCI